MLFIHNHGTQPVMEICRLAFCRPFILARHHQFALLVDEANVAILLRHPAHAIAEITRIVICKRNHHLACLVDESQLANLVFSHILAVAAQPFMEPSETLCAEQLLALRIHVDDIITLEHSDHIIAEHLCG